MNLILTYASVNNLHYGDIGKTSGHDYWQPEHINYQ